ncbi:MAG TPA: VOC family protein [Tepidisphaeraceae bacterium]|jgi:PhnB protein
MQVQPYLMFNGRADEAIQFYKKALGAEVQMVMRFKDCPEPAGIQPGTEDKVMHASLQVGDTTVMLSDGRCQGTEHFDGFSLSLNAADEAQARRLFNALGEGGKVCMPLAKTFFSPLFGMVNDRFGVSWIVIVPHKPQ